MEKQNKKRNIKIVVVCFAVICLTLCFIFGNSLLPSSVSVPASQSVKTKIDNALNIDTDKSATTEKPATTDEPISPELANFRKIAHFSEFFLLGAEIVVGIFICLKLKRSYISSVLFFGLAAAVIDESLQLISGRTSLVTDILIDFCGYSIGAMITFGVCIFIKKLYIKRKRVYY